MATALFGWAVFGSLLLLLLAFALGAVRLGLELVDVVVLSTADLDVVLRLDWLVVLRVGLNWIFVPAAESASVAVHLVNVDRGNALVHDDVVLFLDGVASLLGEDVLDVVCVGVHVWCVDVVEAGKIPFTQGQKRISIF